VSGRAPGEIAGTVRWAVAPYAPQPPFRIYAAGREPYTVEDPEQLIGAARVGGDAEFTYLVRAKARPVLILNNPARSEWQEVTALRLMRFSKIADPEKQERVRQQKEPLLFYLDPQKFELPEENAVLIPALVTIGIGAIGSGQSLGELDDNELRVLGERLIRYYEFDTRLLVEQMIRELADRRRQPGR